MEKVKLTQEQADAIENISFREEAAKLQINGWKHRENRCLNHLTFDDFIKALYIGYEVEPKFKEWDWVVYRDEVFRITVKLEDGTFVIENDRAFEQEIPPFLLRYATPEEIAKAKRRRWWNYHNRDEWEVREKDLLINLENYKFIQINEIEGNEIWYAYINEYLIDNMHISELCDSNFKVVFFSEDKKDV